METRTEERSGPGTARAEADGAANSVPGGSARQAAGLSPAENSNPADPLPITVDPAGGVGMSGAGMAGSDQLLAARLRGSVNPLLGAAAALLDLTSSLRDRASHEDPNALRDSILAELRRFDEAAAQAGLSGEEIRIGRFALCATLDDVVRATPWGGRTRWARVGLVSLLDHDAVRPDHFFELLDSMLGDPRSHRHTLELFYACLSLGFEGKFRDRPRGAHDIAHLRDELYRVLRRLRGERERGLSPAWRGLVERFRPLGLALPPFVVPVVIGLVLVAIHLFLVGRLTDQAEPLAARLEQLVPDQPITIVRAVPPPPPSAGPALVARLTDWLAPEIRSGALTVLSGEDGALVIRLDGTAMFARGSDAPRARFRAVIDRIGETLSNESGEVMVVGHADDATGRATAQSLSLARAEAVRELLAQRVGFERLGAVGRGDAEPAALGADGKRVAGNNRRVDLRLYPR